MQTNSNLNLEHIKLLFAIAKANSVISSEEKLFILSKAKELNVHLTDNLNDTAYDLENIKDFSHEDAENILSDIVYLMMVDGAIHKQEYLICSKIAELLGLNDSYLNHIISLVEKLWKRDINNC